MRKLLLAVLLCSPLVADICMAQANAITIMCEDCRDPNVYPNDYVNFAFNQIYGADAWLSFDQADDFFVTNLDNQRVYVDVDFVSLGIGFKGFGIPFWPTNVLQFTLALPNGTILVALRSIFLWPLPVPSSPDDPITPPPENVIGENDGSDEGEDYDDAADDDYDWDLDIEEFDFDEYEGVVGIEDPDEFGEFDDPEWCEEC